VEAKIKMITTIMMTTTEGCSQVMKTEVGEAGIDSKASAFIFRLYANCVIDSEQQIAS
jgi:uncharacterized protein YceK